MSYSRPQFRGSLMGYNKLEVSEYVSKLESEIDSFEKKQKTWDEKISFMELDAIRLNNELAAKDDSKAEILDKNQELEKTIADLQAKLRDKDATIAKMEEEYRELKKTYDESEYNPKLIQEAILNAQNFGKQIVAKANEDASGIRSLAEAEKELKRAEGLRVIAEANRKAQSTMEKANIEAQVAIAQAERKCEKLQENYNQILLDASGFKAELMALYRRHMEMLTAFPERELPVIDVEVKDVE